MSLLKKASIITTPTAYAEDYLYSIKPAYALGSEQVTNGNFATDSNWIKGTGVTISNGKAVFTNVSNANQGLSQLNVAVIGKKYKITFTISDYSQGAVYILRPTTLGASSAVSSNGTFTFTLVAQTSTAFILFTVGTTTLSIDNVSIKEIIDADFDFDRNSTGTRVNEDYLIEDVPYNLSTYSEDFTQWTNTRSSDTSGFTSPIGTDNATHLITDNTASSSHIIKSSNFTISSGQKLTYSLFAKAKEYSYVRLLLTDSSVSNFLSVYFNLSNGTIGTTSDGSSATLDSANIEAAGNGWYRCSVTGDLNTTTTAHLRAYIAEGDNDSTIDGDGTSGILIWGAQVVKGDQQKDYLKTTDRLDIPRIDYTNGEPSILLEPSRQNEATYSEDFTQSYWSKDNVTVTSNQAISPEGIQNADKVVINNGTFTINCGLYKSRSSTANQDVSFSIFAKAGEFRYGTIAYGSTNANGFHFDLEDGVILSTFTNTSKYTNIGYEMIAYPNGWYRLVVSTTELQQGVGRFIGIRPHHTIPTSTNNNYNSTGDGTSGIFVYGAQIEVGSHSTSLIHTSGSAVTRSADAANNAGNSDLFNDSEGVLYAEIKALADDSEIDGISISDGTGTNRVVIFKWSASNTMRGRVTSGGTNTLNQNFTVSDITSFKKIAIKYKLNDFAIWLNGSEVFTDTSGAVPSGLNVLAFSSVGSGGADFYGNAKMVAVFKEALTDLELAKLTGYNNHELYMNYYNRLSYLGLVEEYNVESDINNYIL